MKFCQAALCARHVIHFKRSNFVSKSTNQTFDALDRIRSLQSPNNHLFSHQRNMTQTFVVGLVKLKLQKLTSSKWISSVKSTVKEPSVLHCCKAAGVVFNDDRLSIIFPTETSCIYFERNQYHSNAPDCTQALLLWQ